jgi:hypothetical protein
MNPYTWDRDKFFGYLTAAVFFVVVVAVTMVVMNATDPTCFLPGVTCIKVLK